VGCEQNGLRAAKRASQLIRNQGHILFHRMFRLLFSLQKGDCKGDLFNYSFGSFVDFITIFKTSLL
jgi:hypothetical protein